MKLLIAALLAALGFAASAADKKHSEALPEVPAVLTPERADAFLARLTDAQARGLLARELHAKAEKKAEALAPEKAAGLSAALMQLAKGFERTESDFGQRSALVVQGSSVLPAAMAGALAQLFGGGILAFLAAVLITGALVSWAVRRALRPRGLDPTIGIEAAAPARLSVGAVRFVLDLLPFLAFALVTLVVANSASAPGTPERSVLVGYVTGAIAVSAAAVLLRLVLAPSVPALRLLPLSDEGAAFLYRWLMGIWAIMVFSGLTVGFIGNAGIAHEALLVLSVLGGTVVAVALIAMVLAARSVVPVARLPGLFARNWHLLGVVYVLLVWVLWASAVLDEHPDRAGAAIWSLAAVLAFPLFDHWIGRAISDIVGEAGTESMLGRQAAGRPLRWAMRLLLGVVLVASVNELWDFHAFEWQAKLREALLSSSFDLLMAFAVAVLGWQFIRVAIDRRLQSPQIDGRMRTLLPLARVFLVTALIIATVMLVLSALGVNIAPLLAGAGIVGLAIGFGAQTLVRDIITGVFLIMDDAFRVGEYIQSGNYKGTVESIGLRSVKLRHHRGPIYVVPFGELRGVQNLARDWVIMKFTVGITYDSDLEKARKLVKKIGQELAADPEFTSEILSPLKMQGVEAFGDFAIQIRMKIMTKPGEKQFLIRRKAYALIKKAFDANGIKFAFPTVQIAGGGEAAAVAAAATRVPGIAGDQAA